MSSSRLAGGDAPGEKTHRSGEKTHRSGEKTHRSGRGAAAGCRVRSEPRRVLRGACAPFMCVFISAAVPRGSFVIHALT
eukprot:6257562-Pyramimonas_sp.AAC.1